MAQEAKKDYIESARQLMFDVVEKPRYFAVMAYFAILIFSAGIYASSSHLGDTLILALFASGTGVLMFFLLWLFSWRDSRRLQKEEEVQRERENQTIPAERLLEIDEDSREGEIQADEKN